MGQKILALRQFFSPRLCQNFNLPVHRTILMKFFFKKITTLLMTFWQLTKKSSAFRHKKFGRVVKTSLSRVHRNIWWEKKNFLSFFIIVEVWVTNFWLLTEILPRCSQYCFLLAHRKILIKESSYEKVIFFDISNYADFEREKLAFLSKTFGLVRQNCNLPELKLFAKNSIFQWETSLMFLSDFSASIIEENRLAFPEKTGGFVKNAFDGRTARFFWEKKNFWKKFPLYHFGTWGKKHWLFNFFSHGCVRTSIYLSIGPFWWRFFSKKIQLFSWLSDNWQKKLQPLVMKNLAG